MAGDRLLDTNIVIALFNDDPAVKQEIGAAESVLLSSTVVGELYFGVFESRRLKENRTRLEEFLRDVVALPCDLATAEHYGQIKQQLLASGRPIPDNDIWIAACARQHGLTVVSRDRHFEHIPGLDVIRW